MESDLMKPAWTAAPGYRQWRITAGYFWISSLLFALPNPACTFDSSGITAVDT